MQDSDDIVAAQLAEILERTAEIMELAQFDENEKIDFEAAVQRLRLMGKNAEADELGDLFARARELEGTHPTEN